jgi:methylmalonyl-CoA/ethylmalonyl-CoA epimerase
MDHPGGELRAFAERRAFMMGDGRFMPPARIGQIAVPVVDLDRAVDFYARILGLPLLFRAPPGLAFFDCGGVRLMLSRPEGPDAPPRASVIYYVVADLASAYTALVARGVDFVSAPHRVARLPDHDLWMAFCRDSEENLLGLMSEVRPPEPQP